MIQVFNRPGCVVCGAGHTDRTAVTDMCSTCRRRMFWRHDADPVGQPIEAWLRHMTGQVMDAIRPTGKRPPYKAIPE